MSERSENAFHTQDTEPLGESDHLMDGAHKLRDTKVGNATTDTALQMAGCGRRETDTSDAGGSNADIQVTQTEKGYSEGPGSNGVGGELEVMCGPLLNYKGMHQHAMGNMIWNGSVLIVAKPGQQQPELRLRYVGAVGRETQSGSTTADGTIGGLDGQASSAGGQLKERLSSGVKLYADPTKAFWRFTIDLPLQDLEGRWEFSIANLRFSSGVSPRTSSSRSFAVPAISQSMRIMFHSCNGFSVGTDEDAWSGPALWNDVLRVHESKPFHVMIGGGDQIYNDGVRVDGPLREWTEIKNPHRRREYPFPEKLRAECDLFYFENYVKWFSTEPFASANGQIPQLNIWDDHDIIDGFGSYVDHFMRCAVFRGIGGISFKYYVLFQHHLPPPISTYTTDAPQTMEVHPPNGVGADPVQLNDTFFLKDKEEDPSWIIGARPGPYVEEHSRSIYMRLGARIGFLGIDARTERTRRQVNYPDTYDLIFKRVRSELSRTPDLNHLILLLGIPIAYPRLIWLENILTSPIIGPIRFLSKRFGLAGGLFNKFDGQVDILDDLDDHYTAHAHKHERKDLMLRLQALARDYSIRITILGGDVHLGALGRFYSKPKLRVPMESDHRYMANIISSAITNHPPPMVVANLLARRNKIHHLDLETDETLMPFFDKDPGNSTKTGLFNHCTMPSRNYAIITENPPAENAAPNGTANGQPLGSDPAVPPHHMSRAERAEKDGHSFLGAGEEGAGTKHAAASGVHRGTLQGGLDVSLRVEIDGHDREGTTEGYGFSIPSLRVGGKAGF